MTIRLDDHRLLSTPSGVSKGHLEPGDMVVIDREGNVIGDGVVRSEIRLHLELYDQREDCMAVVHAHPIVATSLTLAGVSLPDDLVPEGTVVLGPVASVPFAMPGTSDMAAKIRPFVMGHTCFLLANHGAVTMGGDLFDAMYRMETLERVAKMYFSAKLLGHVEPMPAEAYASLVSAKGGRN